MKKILALALCLVLAFSFAGCGCGKKVDNNAEVATDATDAAVVLETVEEGKLIMATNAAFPPYEMKEGEEFVGIDVEIATAIAEKLGLELQINDMEFSSIINAVSAGEVDFGMAGMTVRPDREEFVDFTYSYATGVQSVIVKADSGIATLDDLAGKMIGTQLGTTGFIYASDTVENGGFGEEFVKGYSTGADAILALVGGDIDAVIIDDAPANVFVEENEGLVILDAQYAVEDYAIAVAKGNDALTDAINNALEELKVDGTIDAIIAKYISAE